MSLDRALAWADAGYAVFPVRVAQDADGRWSKRPLTPNGHKDATTDPAQVRELWAHGARVAQVGVAVEASGLVVVDVDPRNGGERPDLPSTYTVTTVSGGEHLYYRGTTDRRHTSWRGVDLKGNGFVVAYGEPPNGNPARWSDAYLGGGWVDVAPSGAGRWTVEDAEAGFGEGERNEGLWWYASYLRGRVAGLTLDEAEDRMAEAARVCRPPYDEDAARDMARRAFDAYEAAPEPRWDDVRRPEAEPVSMSWGELKAREWPTPRWIVPGVVPEGLTVLAGKRKIGKSWLVGQLACAVAGGGEFLGVTLEGGDALYLALEDPLRRLAGRLPAPPTPEAGARLTLRRTAPRLDGGLVDELEDWRLGREAPRLVIVDTLGLVRPRRNGTGSDGGYDDSYEDIGALKRWADETGVAVVVIHHARKSKADDDEAGDPLDLVLGSSGIVSAADTILVLQRGHESEKGALRGTGRDIEDVSLWLKFDQDTCQWTKGLPTYKELMAKHGIKRDEARRWITALGKADDAVKMLEQLAAANRAQMRAQDGAQGGAQQW